MQWNWAFSPTLIPDPGFLSSSTTQHSRMTRGTTGAANAKTKRTIAPSWQACQTRFPEFLLQNSQEIGARLPTSTFLTANPRVESALQVENVLEAWDRQLQDLDIGHLPESWKSFSYTSYTQTRTHWDAWVILFSGQQGKNSPKLTSKTQNWLYNVTITFNDSKQNSGKQHQTNPCRKQLKTVSLRMSKTVLRFLRRRVT